MVYPIFLNQVYVTERQEHTLQTIISQAGSCGRKDGHMDRQTDRWTHTHGRMDGWIEAEPRDGSLW